MEYFKYKTRKELLENLIQITYLDDVNREGKQMVVMIITQQDIDWINAECKSAQEYIDIFQNDAKYFNSFVPKYLESIKYMQDNFSKIGTYIGYSPKTKLITEIPTSSIIVMNDYVDFLKELKMDYYKITNPTKINYLVDKLRSALTYDIEQILF